MQFKFISLGLFAAVLMTIVSASNDITDGDNWPAELHDPAGKNGGGSIPYEPSKIEVAPPQKRDPSASKKIASTIRRRRALSRRDKEVDGEEEENKDENKEGNSSEEKSKKKKEDSVAFATEADISADAKEDYSSEDTKEKTSDDNGSKNREWERRSPYTTLIPHAGILLGNYHRKGLGTVGKYDDGQDNSGLLLSSYNP